MGRIILTLIAVLFMAGAFATIAPPPELAATDPVEDATAQTAPDPIGDLCRRLGEKLSSVGTDECHETGLLASGHVTNESAALAYRDFLPVDGKPQVRVLLVGGIHGDEYSSVSVVFKWLRLLEAEDTAYHWRVVPLANPDGLLRPPDQSQRMNANGVDLNRNFPTPDWDREALAYWEHRTRGNKRRYPGPSALSEPETRWLVEQLETFRPHAVISVHAPHGIVDFDGPKIPPANLGPLELHLLGTYPGSMGRYIGVHRNIPLLTVELESAGRMPSRKDLVGIWQDMLAWLDARVVPALADDAVQPNMFQDLRPGSPDS